MKNKIKNWLKKHEYICGFGLLCISLCTVAFGGAYLGVSTAMSNTAVEVYLASPEEVSELITE